MRLYGFWCVWYRIRLLKRSNCVSDRCKIRKFSRSPFDFVWARLYCTRMLGGNDLVTCKDLGFEFHRSNVLISISIVLYSLYEVIQSNWSNTWRLSINTNCDYNVFLALTKKFIEFVSSTRFLRAVASAFWRRILQHCFFMFFVLEKLSLTFFFFLISSYIVLLFCNLEKSVTLSFVYRL